MQHRNQTDTKSVVSESGNSDVDVTVNIDTSALAYAFACYLYADGRLDQNQYRTMVREMDRQFKRRGYQSMDPNYNAPLIRPWAL
ncbi:hypothetical protein RYX56_14265 [Alkalihalophilus lindianensis]|uniref:Uncharacterized protein n=1 Tax=Alkalihalophilus lindianensis TaxID=1630542 RepID=A0ABU3XCB7_9BACI|nr:hypothetical protein [Alkalihalophilus lindianensis]MDV2685527.1 hypothetical protein [Alkalihalophilus lindianensis]